MTQRYIDVYNEKDSRRVCGCGCLTSLSGTHQGRKFVEGHNPRGRPEHKSPRKSPCVLVRSDKSVEQREKQKMCMTCFDLPHQRRRRRCPECKEHYALEILEDPNGILKARVVR
jgi:hypothetical protein